MPLPHNIPVTFKERNTCYMKYDYLVVGSGLYGAIFAHEAKVHGKSVLVVDKRPNIAGNIYTENIEGINVHKYGAHIFHTNNKKVWNYITRFAEFNRTESICFYSEFFGDFTVSKDFYAISRIGNKTSLNHSFYGYNSSVLITIQSIYIDSNDFLGVSVFETSLRKTSV